MKLLAAKILDAKNWLILIVIDIRNQNVKNWMVLFILRIKLFLKIKHLALVYFVKISYYGILDIWANYMNSEKYFLLNREFF